MIFSSSSKLVAERPAPLLGLLPMFALTLGASACRQNAGEQPARARQTVSEAQVPPDSRAGFFAPTGIASVLEVDGIGSDRIQLDYLLLADTLNHTVRRVEPLTGLATTFAGTAGVAGSAGNFFREPTAVAAGGVPLRTFVADTGNHTIRKVYLDPATGLRRYDTLAGSPGQPGYATSGAGLFRSPAGLAVGLINDVNAFNKQVLSLYVADTGNAVIRKVNLQNGQVELVAGTPGQHGYANAAVGTAAKFRHPTGLAYNHHDHKLYVADTGNHVIRVIDVRDGASVVTTLAGVPGEYGHGDGALAGALFAQPTGVAYGVAGKVFVSDRASYTIRTIDVDPAVVAPEVRTVAGHPWESGAIDGEQPLARFRAPTGVAVLGAATPFVSDTGNNLVRELKAKPQGFFTSTLVGMRPAGSGDGWPAAFSIGRPQTLSCAGNKLYIDGQGAQVIDLDASGDGGAVRVIASSNWTGFVPVAGNIAKRLDYRIALMNLQTGEWSATEAITSDDGSVDAILPAGAAVLVRFTDTTGPNGTTEVHLRRYNIIDGAWTSPQPMTGPLFYGAAAWDGTHIYWREEATLQKANPYGSSLDPAPIAVPGLAGAGDLAGLAVAGGYAYFTGATTAGQTVRHDVRRIDLETGEIETVAGMAQAADAPFEDPRGLCVSGNGLFVADTGNGAIHRIDLVTHARVTLALRRAQ